MADKTPVDVSDPVQVKENKSIRKLREERNNEELRQLLETEGGRGFIWRLLSKCKMFNSIPVIDPIQMAASTARANLGKEILAECMIANNSSYMKMINEAEKREK